MIGLREGLETVVIVGAIVVFLRIQNRGDLVRSVWRASAIAAAICIVLAVVLRLVEAGLPLRPQQGLQTIISVAAVLMVTYMIVWMRAFPKDHLSDSRNAVAAALDGNAGHALVLMAFFAVLREGIEISVFVIATLGITGGNGWLAALGVIVGIAVALIIGVGVVRGSRHLNTAMFFRVERGHPGRVRGRNCHVRHAQRLGCRMADRRSEAVVGPFLAGTHWLGALFDHHWHVRHPAASRGGRNRGVGGVPLHDDDGGSDPPVARTGGSRSGPLLV